MNKKKYYRKRKNRRNWAYELPNNHRKWIGFKRGEYMENDITDNLYTLVRKNAL